MNPPYSYNQNKNKSELADQREQVTNKNPVQNWGEATVEQKQINRQSG